MYKVYCPGDYVTKTTLSALTKNLTTTTAAKKKNMADIEAEQH